MSTPGCAMLASAMRHGILELSVGQWAADGLLAVFFFLVGLELKREIVIGRFAIGTHGDGPGRRGRCWRRRGARDDLCRGQPGFGRQQRVERSPPPPDIAFAVAVLAVVGSSCRWRCDCSC